jgi:hypothetical protein
MSSTCEPSPSPSREPRRRAAFVVAGVLLSLLHIALTFLIVLQLPFHPPRPMTPFEQRLQYLLCVLHPYGAIQRWLFPLPAALALFAFFAETFLWGFGIAWVIGWLRRTLARQGGN